MKIYLAIQGGNSYYCYTRKALFNNKQQAIKFASNDKEETIKKINFKTVDIVEFFKIMESNFYRSENYGYDWIVFETNLTNSKIWYVVAVNSIRRVHSREVLHADSSKSFQRNFPSIKIGKIGTNGYRYASQISLEHAEQTARDIIDNKITQNQAEILEYQIINNIPPEISKTSLDFIEL